MYSTNDADARRHRRQRLTIELPECPAELGRLVAPHQQGGAAVIEVTSPPTGIASAGYAIAHYWAAAPLVRVRMGAHFLDPACLITHLSTPVACDGIHVTARATAAIAPELARKYFRGEMTYRMSGSAFARTRQQSFVDHGTVEALSDGTPLFGAGEP
jgi:hypothetical protein